jgi:hypothetical protein
LVPLTAALVALWTTLVSVGVGMAGWQGFRGWRLGQALDARLERSQLRMRIWVSLDTKHPECFQVVLDSGYWSNRRAEVKRYSGANASVRAEIPLRRSRRQLAHPADRSRTASHWTR